MSAPDKRDSLPVEDKLAEHRPLDAHKCRCGWQGDVFAIHVVDVYEALRAAQSCSYVPQGDTDAAR